MQTFPHQGMLATPIHADRHSTEVCVASCHILSIDEGHRLSFPQSSDERPIAPLVWLPHGGCGGPTKTPEGNIQQCQ